MLAYFSIRPEISGSYGSKTAMNQILMSICGEALQGNGSRDSSEELCMWLAPNLQVAPALTSVTAPARLAALCHGTYRFLPISLIKCLIPEANLHLCSFTVCIMAVTRLPTITNDSSKIQLERIAHVYFDHPDLDSFNQFALDFGLVEAFRSDDHILYRGYGVDPYCYVARRSNTNTSTFGGAAFIAQTHSDFDKAAALDGATVSELSPFPGGGKRVTVKTPLGFYIHVVYGQEEKLPAEKPLSAQVESLGPMNGSISKHRFGRKSHLWK